MRRLTYFLAAVLAICSCDRDDEPESFGKPETITAKINEKSFAVSLDPLQLKFNEGDATFWMILQGYAIPERNIFEVQVHNNVFAVDQKYATSEGDLTYNIVIWDLEGGGRYSQTEGDEASCDFIVSEFESGNEPDFWGNYRITRIKAKINVSLTYFNPKKPDEHLKVFPATILVNFAK
jgi:hypothetical protein